MKNTKRQQVPLKSLIPLTGSWAISMDGSTNQLKLTKTKAAETGKVAAEITPPVPAQREPFVGHRLKSVEFSGVIADAVQSSLSIDIYKTILGNANATTNSIAVGTTGVPTEVGEFTAKADVDEPVVDGKSKYFAALSAACASTCGIDIRGVMASFEEVDDTRM